NFFSLARFSLLYIRLIWFGWLVWLKKAIVVAAWCPVCGPPIPTSRGTGHESITSDNRRDRRRDCRRHGRVGSPVRGCRTGRDSRRSARRRSTAFPELPRGSRCQT